MSIRRHGRGWEVRIQHGGVPISKTLATRSDAVYFEATVKRRINDTRAGRIPTYTLEEAFVRWLSREAKQLKTFKSCESIVRRIFTSIQKRPLHEIVEVAGAIEEAGLEE